MIRISIISSLLTLSMLCMQGQTENTLQLDNDGESPKASIQSLQWLHGEWFGEGLGGTCEEIWSSARAGSMVGTFRLIKDGKQLFSEYMEIVEQEGTILLRLKHFGSDFVGWEEKDQHVTFKLVKVTGDTHYFDGLTYRRLDENTMEVFVVISSDNGSREEKFTYHRHL